MSALPSAVTWVLIFTAGQGLSMLVAYTYEKNTSGVNGVGAQNFYNLKAEKAVTSYDIPQNFVAGYTYDLPIGKGKLLGSTIH
jgi:hypothetical protein